MKNKEIKENLKHEVNSMLPDNMVAEIKNQDVRVERINRNISVIHEKPRHSIVPMIASCVASVIICLAVFLPIALKSKDDYNAWLAQQKQNQQIEQVEDFTESENN